MLIGNEMGVSVAMIFLFAFKLHTVKIKSNVKITQVFQQKTYVACNAFLLNIPLLNFKAF